MSSKLATITAAALRCQHQPPTQICGFLGFLAGPATRFTQLNRVFAIVHGTINFNQPGSEQTNKRRPEVPINARALAALEEAVRGALTDHVIEWDSRPVKSIKKAIRMAAKRSGVPCSPHVFRHTAGVWMAQADVPMQKISQFLGHTSTRVTERTYARYSPSFMEDAAAALEF